MPRTNSTQSPPVLTPNGTPSPRGPWPGPPLCVPAGWLNRPPKGARITVAGLVLVRQRPGTAKGVIFITLEDETGICNVIVWRNIYEAFRRAVISGRMLKVTGRLQRDSGVTHLVAETIEDISALLDDLAAQDPLRCDDGSQPHSP